MERINWSKAVGDSVSPIASPATVGFSTLPWHWSLIDQSRGWRLGQNLLPGSSFDSVQSVLASGWQHYWHETDGVKSRVDILPEASHTGAAGIRLAAIPDNAKEPPTLIETPPVWLKSPAIRVEAGTLVRIHGWVHIPKPLTGSVDGLMIFDSFTGMALAERIGETTDWQPFTLYRIAPESGPLTVTFALSGLGEVWLDDLSIQPLGPPAGGPMPFAPQSGLKRQAGNPATQRRR